VDLLAVRHWSAPDHTRIVVDLSDGASYVHRELEDPPRVAVDVTGGRFRIPQHPIEIGDGLVKRVRFNELNSIGKVQVVLDLEVSARYDVFVLEKIEEKPDRIVIDVKRPSALPPLHSDRPKVEHRIGPESFGDFLIMVDPGHGGEDSGRRNPDGLREKNLALEFSRALVEEINSRRGFHAELTRNGDYFVSLKRRRDIAEERGAHLFVSIHFNAAESRAARGTEVFFVSLSGAEDRKTRELVQSENSADLVGGIPPNDDNTTDHLAQMLVDLRQADSVERSQQLAVTLTDHVGRIQGLPTRNVKQAGFAVLKSLFIPAVLVEVGFLTNKDDLRFAKSSRSRDQFVESITDGLVQYCERVEIPRLGWKIHTVSSGESLSAIASNYAMNVEALKQANHLNGEGIRPGQKLRVRPR
jgi:N-acetylmuramoyl-L-alanine amidase